MEEDFLSSEAEKLIALKPERIATILKHQLRGILMNDLGLSRESVRQEMKTIVDSALQRSVDAMVSSSQIERLVTAALDRKYNLKAMFEAEIQRQAAAYFRDHLSVTLKS